MLGPDVTVGFAYDCLDYIRLQAELKNLLEFLIKNNGILKEYSAAKDSDGENWFESNEPGKYSLQEICLTLANGYYGSVGLLSNLLALDQLNVSCLSRKIYKKISSALKSAFGNLI